MRTLASVFAIALAGLATPAAALELTSSSFGADGKFADKNVAGTFGCTGGNMSPQLTWSGAPEGTKSFAVTMYDPDAPTGSGFWHWLVYNLPPTATELPEGAGSDGSTLPDGAVQGRNDAGMNAYMGPCPPEGDDAHRYVITVFAVDVEALPAELPSAAVLGFNLHFHTLDKASVTYTYGR
ncbi:MAG: YbhB/YbcL family Raf kinase inhibitor-like protein [Rhodobiaceae bacterium]|nr:YbhB/YbcL family Raf kinase inhibitor-like protein [Rhodobiaceae bacterium]